MKARAKEKPTAVAPDLEKYRGDYSAARFWGKLSALPQDAGQALVEKAITLFVILSDAKTPLWVRLLIIGVLGYFICPLDLVPDAIPVLGYVDDLAAMTLLAMELNRFLTPAMSERVQNLMPKGMKQPTKTD